MQSHILQVQVNHSLALKNMICQYVIRPTKVTDHVVYWVKIIEIQNMSLLIETTTTVILMVMEIQAKKINL
jgi:hypothetical protein